MRLIISYYGIMIIPLPLPLQLPLLVLLQQELPLQELPLLQALQPEE